MKKYEQNNFIIARKKARKKFKEIPPQELAANSGADFQSDNNRLRLRFLADDYFIDYPEGEIYLADKQDKEIDLKIQILILYYLNKASGAQVKDELISYREIPHGGNQYYDIFKRRAIDPLVNKFGHQPEKLIEAGKKLNGETADTGDYSITIPVLPKVPMTLIIWAGDDELPPSGNILLNKSILGYLSAKDIYVAAGITVKVLTKTAENLE
ncbi:DUF3786 domain-containing protein [Acetohalobium arabaticum]|uniref:DUF3786 domain-containing protein n=1 Tax=Acetohalobium arabaticum (strain ATCC 49924 / DSM 5501 / Z-7288) TaxID=574087 RepID=D9QR92_ACEAZ|nr:DUF3786 domain-containing protein [Acetohalobium arabaticum]ADL13033.1 conserved hypothetical protein [Acetohalobium arabaticum DSM 5501]